MSGRTVGSVGKAHGLDGSFYVEAVAGELAAGTVVSVGGREAVVERRAGTDERPLVRVSGVVDRDGAQALRGARLVVPEGDGASPEGEWDADELVGCQVAGVGTVRGVVNAPSCDLLVVGEQELLVPLVRDAVKRVDIEGRSIEVDRRFLGLDEAPTAPSAAAEPGGP